VSVVYEGENEGVVWCVQ